MVCLGCSSTYHTFNAHSKHVYRSLSRIDYAGTSFLICGSFYPLVYYIGFCSNWAIPVYLTGITFFCGMIFILSLLPFFQAPKYRMLRGFAFLGVGLLGVIPFVHFLVVPDMYENFWITLLCTLCMALNYIIGVLIYVSRVPERYYSGKFDVIGNSHNIWHMFILLAAIFHYVGSLTAYRTREMISCPENPNY